MTPTTTLPKVMMGESHLAREFTFRRERHLKALADVLTEKVMPENPTGFTVDPFTLGRASFPEFAYVVSLDGLGARFPGLPGREDVLRWLMCHDMWLTRSGHYVGGWLNAQDRVFELDVSCAVLGLESALALGRANRQAAIFYPFDHHTIPVCADGVAVGLAAGGGSENHFDFGRDV